MQLFIVKLMQKNQAYIVENHLTNCENILKFRTLSEVKNWYCHVYEKKHTHQVITIFESWCFPHLHLQRQAIHSVENPDLNWKVDFYVLSTPKNYLGVFFYSASNSTWKFLFLQLIVSNISIIIIFLFFFPPRECLGYKENKYGETNFFILKYWYSARR